jgi:hypothetical protein
MYLFEAYNRWVYARQPKYTLTKEKSSVIPFDNIHNYRWFVGGNRRMWCVPFDNISNDQCVKFNVKVNNSKFVSVGVLNNDLKPISISVNKVGTCDFNVCIARNITISTIAIGRDDNTTRILASDDNVLIYIEDISDTGALISNIERITYTCASRIQDPISLSNFGSPQSFDKEDIETGSIKSTISFAANVDNYKLEDIYLTSPLCSDHILDWVVTRDTTLPYDVTRSGVNNLNVGNICLGNSSVRFITDEVEGNIVIYHVNHISTGKADYVRLSLIDESGEEIWHSDYSGNVDHTNKSTVDVGGNIFKTLINIPMGVKSQLMESIYSTSLPYVGSLYPPMIFKYSEVSKLCA